MILAVRINAPLVNVLARMPNYGKFLKELVNNKHKIEQISAAFLSNESSTILQNKVPPKPGDPRSFLIPCNFNKAFSCNALADLFASINLMSYSLYTKLSLKTLKPTKMSVRLADQSFQYPVGIAKKMLVEVGKVTFPADFVILEMEEDKPLTDLKLKPLPDNLEYVFLEESSFLLVIISSQLSEDEQKQNSISVLKKHKQAFAWKTTDILGISLCMLAIFHDMIEESIKVFMDDFSVFRSSFDHCLNNLNKMLQRCKDAHLVLNWEKCHFMVEEGIVLRHTVSEAGLKVDKAKNQRNL
ncbi:reverse transcriptase domain-containing protein [Tanacetum coccineum]